LSGAYWAAPLSGGDVDFRQSQLVSDLNNWGEVRYAREETDSKREYRTEVRISAFEGSVVRLIYSETFHETDAGWLLYKYQYNFLDQARDRFFGRHHHPIASITGPDCITHDHCEPPEEPRHYRGVWFHLHEAHGDYLWWAADPAMYPNCAVMKPLTG
jgi:hypothetical protein